MPATHTVTCDGCGKDLTHTGNCRDYRLALVNQGIPSRGGFVTAMMAYPAIEQDAYFCRIECMRVWFDKTYPAKTAAA